MATAAACAGLALATGWAVCGPDAEAAAADALGLLKKMMAKMMPASASRQSKSHSHHGQGYFCAAEGGGGGTYLLDILELASQLGPLTVCTRGS